MRNLTLEDAQRLALETGSLALERAYRGCITAMLMALGQSEVTITADLVVQSMGFDLKITEDPKVENRVTYTLVKKPS